MKQMIEIPFEYRNDVVKNESILDGTMEECIVGFPNGYGVVILREVNFYSKNTSIYRQTKFSSVNIVRFLGQSIDGPYPFVIDQDMFRKVMSENVLDVLGHLSLDRVLYQTSLLIDSRVVNDRYNRTIENE